MLSLRTRISITAGDYNSIIIFGDCIFFAGDILINEIAVCNCIEYTSKLELVMMYIRKRIIFIFDTNGIIVFDSNSIIKLDPKGTIELDSNGIIEFDSKGNVEINLLFNTNGIIVSDSNGISFVLDINSAKMGQARPKRLCRSNFDDIWVMKTSIGLLYLFAIIDFDILYGQGLTITIDKGLSGSDIIAIIVKNLRVFDSLGTIYDTSKLELAVMYIRKRIIFIFDTNGIIVFDSNGTIELDSNGIIEIDSIGIEFTSKLELVMMYIRKRIIFIFDTNGIIVFDSNGIFIFHTNDIIVFVEITSKPELVMMHIKKRKCCLFVCSELEQHNAMCQTSLPNNNG